MYGRRIRLFRRARSYPPKTREWSSTSVERRFPPNARSGPVVPTFTTMGTAIVRPEVVFVTRMNPSYRPRPAFEGTLTVTDTGDVARPGMENDVGDAETHAQSA